MKTALIAICILFAAVGSAQSQSNTFPSSGNVGIGTTSPQARLHISQGDLLLQNTTSGYPTLWLKDVSGSQTLRFDYNSVIMSGNSLYIRSAANHAILLNDVGGNVGIGTSTPSAKLDVNGTFQSYPSGNAGANGALKLQIVATTNGTILQANSDYIWANHDIILNSSSSAGGNSNQLVVHRSGNVGIGTTAPDSKLTVKGVIHAEEVKVDLAVPGPDYVFDEGYPLRSLEDTKTYIDQNKHLPGIPSSDEMQQNGVNLLEMNMKLLEKVEELTLYIIQMNEQMRLQQMEINQLKLEKNEE